MPVAIAGVQDLGLKLMHEETDSVLFLLGFAFCAGHTELYPGLDLHHGGCWRGLGQSEWGDGGLCGLPADLVGYGVHRGYRAA